MELNPQALTHQLLNIPSFSTCSNQDLARIVPHLYEKKYAAGEFLFRSGMPATELYLIQTGTVQLFSDQRLVAEVSEGFVGEEITVEANQYLSDAVALTPTVVIAISQEAIQGLLENNPHTKTSFFSSLFNHYSGKRLLQSDNWQGPLVRSGPDHWNAAGWLMAILFPALLLYFGANLGLDLNARLFLSVFSAVILMWIFRLASSDFIPCILGILVLLFLGVAPASVVLSGFASGSFFMALSVFGLGVVLVASGVTYRMILVILRYIPNSRFWYSLSMLLTGMLLTPVVPTPNGRVSITAPLLRDMTEALDYKPEGKSATQLSVATYLGATCFSTIFLSGSPFNFFIFGLLPLQIREQFSWEYWAFASLITGLIFFILCLILVTIVYRSEDRPHLSRPQIETQLTILGPMSFKEWAALIGISLFTLGLVTAPIHKIETPWIGVAVLYIFLAIGVLTKEEFQREINWSFLVYLGGLIGLVNTLSYLGLDKWIGRHLLWMSQYMQESFLLFILILCVSLFLVQLIIPYSTTVTIFATILIPMAQLSGINAWLIGFIILFISDGWIMPYQSSTYIFFRELTKKKQQQIFAEPSLLTFNALTILFRVAAIYISVPYWRLLGLL